MPEIGNTIYLLAALGIVVPILIHLWNRKPPKIVEVGSIRWLKGSSTQSARRLRPEQWPLLLLRCLMLLLFSLLLAGLFWESSPEEEAKDHLYLIHEQHLLSLDETEIDSLLEAGLQPRLLAPGLPPLADSMRWKNRLVDVWGVLREADKSSEFSDSVWISTPLLQAHFSGERPRLHKAYLFIEADDQPGAAVFHTEAFQQEDRVIVQQAVSSADRIRLRKDTLNQREWVEKGKKSPVRLKEPEALKVSILASDTYARDADIIQYAVEAAASVDESRRLLLNNEMGDAAKSDILFWLKDEPIPVQLQPNTVVVSAGGSATGSGWEWLVQDFTNPLLNRFYLSERPLPELVSREKLSRLPLELTKVLQNDRQETLSRYLPMPVEQALPLRATAAAAVSDADAEQTDLHGYLWLLLFCLFVIERIWVYKS